MKMDLSGALCASFFVGGLRQVQFIHKVANPLFPDWTGQHPRVYNKETKGLFARIPVMRPPPRGQYEERVGKRMPETIDSLRQHQLVILRRLLRGPLTEFELSQEVAGHSGYTPDEAADRMGAWLEELREEGLVWSGRLTNDSNQHIFAAALTRRGRELVG
jgi:hypothetical protein